MRALHGYDVLDTPPELGFDDLTHLAARICQTPTALVTLIDEHRQWFKSLRGFTTTETKRDLAFCAYSILQRDVMVVPDATKDPRFADNALVTGAPHIRFYAGAPLITAAGFALGSLAVIDYVPRQVSAEQIEELQALGRQAVAQLELRRKLREQQEQGLIRDITERKRAETERQQVFERITDAFVALDKNWRYTYLNAKAGQLFGRRPEDLVGKHIWTEFPEGVGQKFHLAYERAMTDQQPVFLEEYYPPYDRWFENRIYPSREGLTIYFHDITGRKKDEALLNGQKHVLELIATGAPLPETLTALVRVIEAQSPEMLCTVLLLDADGVHVRHGAAPSLPVEFARAIDGQPIGPSAGSCGTAAFRREPVVVEDIATDPLWVDYREVALAHGLRACWSTPVFDARKKVLGTFAIYYRQPGRPTAPHLRLTEIATQTAAIAIEREQALAALRLSESRHRRLVESNIIGVMIANTDGRIAEANDLFLGMVGYTREELQTGRVRWDAMTPPEWHAVDAHILAQLQATGVCAPCEKEYFHKDGHRVAILAAVALIEGTPGDCICVIEDLTERKRADAVVHASEQRLRSILDTMFVFVGLINLDGCIVEVNQAPLAAAGLKRIDVLGRTVWESYWFSFSPALQAQVQQALARAAQGEVAREDYSIRLAADRLITIDCTFAPLRDAAGHVTQIVGSAIDITERKQGEQKLGESREQLRALLARLQRAREEERIRMSREVHDELGQLLTGLKMDVRWLERKLSDPNLPAGLLPLLDRAVAASEMADATIATVQKIAAELRPGALDQLGLAASLAQEARRFQERSGVHCTVAAEAWPVLPREVVGELFYICREALTNVSRHAHAKNVVISLAGDGDSAVLEICDDGGGIRKTDLSAPRSLGLLGMKERAAQCGGTVTFARNEPGGTRVTVRMPLVGPVSTEGGGT